MDRSEPPGPGPQCYPPADFRRRAVARLIDLTLAMAPLFLVPRAHTRAAEILSAALLFFGDSLFGPGRSLGKRLAGLRVLVLATRRPAGLRESVLRNGIFVLAVLPAAAGVPVQFCAGALLLIALAEAAVALRPLTRDLGQRRIGDLVAGTQVIDASLAVGLPGTREVPAARAPAPFASRAARTPVQEKPAEEESACASP